MATAKKTAAPFWTKMKPGEWPDKLKEMTEARLAKQREVDAMETEEKAFKAYIIEELPKRVEASGIAGKAYRVDIKETIVPQVQDWDAFYKWIGKTKDFGVLNRAVNGKHVQELWDEGKVVAGVGSIEVNKISLTKLG